MLTTTLSNLLLLAPTLLLTTTALGINCRGSSDCSFATTGAVAELVKLIDGMPDATCVTSGEQIACFDAGITSICAFTQNQKASTKVCGAKLKVLAGNIAGHGCGECGSVPLDWPTTNDDADGELTFNAAESNCLLDPRSDKTNTGLCPGI